jgi:Zn-dependent peptidase ImmA (M78 family)/transcriptional regulator with XRE-family HTH domain
VSISTQELGSRLRAARESCGLKQDDVARHLGLSRPTIAQMELGNRAVTSLELDKLAYFFDRDINWFVNETFEEEDVLAALFRAEPEIENQRQIADRLRSWLALGREITNIENLLGIEPELSGAVSYQVPGSRSRWEAIQQGERAADQERRRMGLGWAPAPSLGKLFEAQGVRTGLVDLPENVSGLTMSNREVGLFVIANRRHTSVRRRFSYAHEYAHTLFDRRMLGTVSRAEDRDELIEVRANAFAAAFLMPGEGVRPFVIALGKGKASRAIAQVFDEAAAVQAEGREQPGSQAIQLYDIVHIAHHYGVSRLTALFRLLNLKLMTQGEFDELKAAEDAGHGRELATMLALPDENEDERDEFHHRVLNLALEAYRRELITRAKFGNVAALLKMTNAEINKLLNRAGLNHG